MNNEKKEFSKTSININRGLTMKMIISLFTSTVSGIEARSRFVLIEEVAFVDAVTGDGAAGVVAASIFTMALLGSTGMIIGLGVWIAISVITSLILIKEV